MQVVEAAWLAKPHPDLATPMPMSSFGDSARPAGAGRDAGGEGAPALRKRGGHGPCRNRRTANSPAPATRWRRSSPKPTQRVAMLMAEIERSEHGDTGRARAWTLRAVRALA